MEVKVNLFWKIPGGEKPGQSIEDHKFRDIIVAGFQRTSGDKRQSLLHFHTCKHVFPDNKRLDLQRARSLESPQIRAS